MLALSGPAFSADLEIDDRVGRFQAFYAEASHAKLSAPARFALWRRHGNMAAVPPGPEGDALARKLLDKAWPRYPALISTLPSLDAAAEEQAREVFAEDNAVLETGMDPIHSRLILYVGQFDDNAYSTPAMDGKPATSVMPVETAAFRPILAHELAHTIHMQLAGVKNAFGAPIGETMFLEGLAMRTAQQAEPGLPDAAYVAMPTDAKWMPLCVKRKEQIIKGILPDLDKAAPAIALKYTFGDGNTGMQRELYCAAWFAFATLSARGETLPELVRLPEDRMIDVMRRALSN